MLNDLLKHITPETLLYVMKSNPLVIQATLHKFESYKAFTEALTNHQQVSISSNLYKVGEFFKSTEGKESLNSFVNTFITFVTKK